MAEDKENIEPEHDLRAREIGLVRQNPVNAVNEAAMRKYLQGLEGCAFERHATKHRSLGEGAEGEVALYSIDGEYLVAVKRSTASDRDLEAEAQLHWRVTQCQQCNGVQYTVPLLMAYHCAATNTLVTVMPVYENGTLDDEIERYRGTPQYSVVLEKRQREGLQALQWLHEKCRMTHNDTHPGNWFIGADKRILLADFGMARVAEQYRTRDQFETLAEYEMLAFRHETSSSIADKKSVGDALAKLEDRIQNDPALMKDSAGKDVL